VFDQSGVGQGSQAQGDRVGERENEGRVKTETDLLLRMMAQQNELLDEETDRYLAAKISAEALRRMRELYALERICIDWLESDSTPGNLAERIINESHLSAHHSALMAAKEKAQDSGETRRE
jgi:hypothetical protein